MCWPESISSWAWRACSREGAEHLRPDSAGAHVRPDLALQFGDDRAFLVVAPRAQGRAKMDQALAQHREQVDFGGLALDHADLHDPSVHRRRLVVPRHIVAGNDIDDHIDPATFGAAQHFLDEILLGVVDRQVSAEAQAGLALGLAGDRGKDFRRAEGLAQHGRGGADAGGATVDQQRLAGLEATALEQVDPDGHEGFRQRRRFLHAQAVGQVQGGALVGHRELRVAAAGNQRHHRLADGEAADLAADRPHRAGDLQAGNVRGAGRRVVHALALKHVGTVDAGGADFDQTSRGPGVGSGRLVATSTSGPPGRAISMAVIRSGNRFVLLIACSGKMVRTWFAW